jgi:ABC-type branched-subunit amino acid transport system ATPase component/ABC-type branched-subunit amino acid transport system permease subunit
MSSAETAGSRAAAARGIDAALRSRGLRRVVAGLSLVLLLAAPYLANDRYLNLLNVWAIYVLLTASICLLSGLTGQFSMGQAAFCAIGAYGTGSLTTVFDWPMWASVPAAVALTAFVGLVVSLPAGRVSDLYLAVITLALLVITTVVLQNWRDVTGGFSGLIGISSVSLRNLEVAGRLITQTEFYYVAAGSALLVLALMSNFVHSPFGRAFVTVRESELAAASLGVRPGYVKKLAFVLSAAIAGWAGVLYTHSVGFLSAEAFDIDMAVAILAMGVLGGLATVRGAVLGSFVLIFVPDQLQSFDEYQLIAYGLVLMVSFVALPKGLSGLLPGRQGFVRRSLADAVPPSDAADELPESAEATADVEINAVSKNFGGVRALDGVSMTVKAGSIHGLIGPNGSGKSTLLNLVSGIYRPTEGAIRYGGVRLSGLSAFRVARQDVARTFQHPVLVDEMTVLESVLAGSRNALGVGWLRAALGTPGARRRERAHVTEAVQLLERLGLGDLLHREVGDLPFGRRRMVELARALVARPRLLMLDEPAAGLGEHELESLADVVRDLRSSGMTVILVEHHMDFIMSLVDECSVLDGGRVIFRGNPAETLASPAVRKAYLGTAGPLDTIGERG